MNNYNLNIATLTNVGKAKVQGLPYDIICAPSSLDLNSTFLANCRADKDGMRRLNFITSVTTHYETTTDLKLDDYLLVGFWKKYMSSKIKETFNVFDKPPWTSKLKYFFDPGYFSGFSWLSKAGELMHVDDTKGYSPLITGYDIDDLTKVLSEKVKWDRYNKSSIHLLIIDSPVRRVSEIPEKYVDQINEACKAADLKGIIALEALLSEDDELVKFE